MIYQFVSSCFPRFAFACYQGQWQSETSLVGTIAIPGIARKLQTCVTFDRTRQIKRICVGSDSLVRQHNLSHLNPVMAQPSRFQAGMVN